MKDSIKQPVSYQISKSVKRMLTSARHNVTHGDWDRVYLIDGNEGSGKSLLALQIGMFLDPTLTLDRITFSGKKFSDAIDNAKKHQCIIFDEAFNGLGSGGAATKMNRLIIRKLMECRQRNLFIIIVLPTFFLLQRYAAIFRSKALFHVYTGKRGERGRYRIYNEKNKKFLYINGKKYFSYAKPYIKKNYRFSNIYPLDEAAYRKKKLEALRDNETEEKADKYFGKFLLMCKLLREEYKMPYTEQDKYLKELKEPYDFTKMSRNLTQLAQKDQE